jgi:hypothetical protein
MKAGLSDHYTFNVGDKNLIYILFYMDVKYVSHLMDRLRMVQF